MKAAFNLILSVCILFLLCTKIANGQQTTPTGKPWSIAKAQAWYQQHSWINGANFIPSTAVNQLEMWQAGTFDPKTIDRELGYAEGIGFNTMRVFLHSVAYTADPEGFKSRVKVYLKIAAQHHIQTIFVIFDDCWNPDPKPGKQPAPKTGVHNSGWLQDPGGVVAVGNVDQWKQLERYVKDIITTFSHDQRVLAWDLYNEPGNSNKGSQSYGLLVKVFSWARAVNPSQPVTAGLWRWDFEQLNTYQVLNSDVLTYHDYEDSTAHERVLELLKTHGRPMICTEYMARRNKSTFALIMPMLKREKVGAINWGLVAGKTNTIYAWDTPMPAGDEPKEWFHDIFRIDGTPYREEEVDLIRKLNNK